MRYSEIARDLSTDSMRYMEVSKKINIIVIKYNNMYITSQRVGGGAGEDYIYKNLREESPSSQSESLYSNYHSGSSYDSHTMDNNQHRSNCLRNSKRFSGGLLGNGTTANGSATISYVRQRKDSAKSIQSCHMDLERLTQSAGKLKNGKRKNSIGCLNTLSSSPGSPGGYYGMPSAPSTNSIKSQSLPAQSSIKNLDAIIMSALRVPADELAAQITLLDFPVFAAIQPDELTSCAWTKKDKHIVTPNIVAFTKRFNHTSFWTVQEILSGETPKQRAEILIHFIKVRKLIFLLLKIMKKWSNIVVGAKFEYIAVVKMKF